MSKDRPEPGDPLELVGHSLEAGSEDWLEEMARTFIEEFRRMGWTEEALLTLFRQPGYRGPHHAYRILGEARILELIRGAENG